MHSTDIHWRGPSGNDTVARLSSLSALPLSLDGSVVTFTRNSNWFGRSTWMTLNCRTNGQYQQSLGLNQVKDSSRPADKASGLPRMWSGTILDEQGYRSRNNLQYCAACARRRGERGTVCDPAVAGGDPSHMSFGTRPASATRYIMGGVLEQCVQRYLELANVSIDTLKPSTTPRLDDQNFTEEDWTDTKGTLAPIAASVLMNMLYLARCCRFDLLFPVCALAREVTKWTNACGNHLHT